MMVSGSEYHNAGTWGDTGWVFPRVLAPKSAVQSAEAQAGLGCPHCSRGLKYEKWWGERKCNVCLMHHHFPNAHFPGLM